MNIDRTENVDVRQEISGIARALRARLENENWFGVSRLPRGSAPSAPVKNAAEPARSSMKTEGSEAPGPQAASAGESSGTRSLSPREKAEALAELADSIAPCEACEVGESRTNLVFGEGNPDARIMFIGEAPGRDEDRQGRPFVGRAGQLLDKIIEAMGMKREDVYIANILKCRPPSNRTPTPEESAVCRETVFRQIEIIAPDIIIALGGVAALGLLDTKGALGSLRGRAHDFRGTKAVVTYHPAYLLRNPDAKRMVWDDVKMAMAMIGISPPAPKKRK